MVRLSEFRGRKAVVLYFYPKDDTPGCTKESCAFRDSYQDFLDAGAEVIGVSGDDSSSHERFATKYHLPFVLLSDRGGQVRPNTACRRRWGSCRAAVTFVIDRDGIVRHTFNSQFQPTQHIAEAITALRQLDRPAAQS